MALSVSSRRVLKRPTTGSEKIAKYQRHKTVLVLVLLCTLLISLIVAAGYLYTWLMSNQIMPNDALTNINYKPVEIKKPVARINQKVSVAVSSLSSPVAAGQTVDLSVRTNIDAICTVDVLAPTKKLVDGNLSAKAADEYGIVLWSWTVPKGTTDGKWPITVSCSNKEYSGVVKTDLMISTKS